MKLSGSRVLVAGGTSFLGVNLIQRLLAMDCKVKATIHTREPLLTDPRIEYVQTDLRVMDDCMKAAKDVDYVFMCAANTAGAAVMTTTPLVQVTPNVVMNTQMLEASYASGVKKFLFISSSAAYPPTGSRPTKEDEMFVGEPHDSYFAVGWMKRYAEILCNTYANKIKKPMPVVVVRPSNVFGPYDKFDFKTSHMMAALIRRVADRQAPMEIWGTGGDIRDLIYVDDFVDGTILAFEKSDNFLAVNIGFGKGYSVRELLETLVRLEGFRDADIRYDASKPQTIPVRLVDTTLAKEKLGFTPKISIEEGLSRTLNWYKENRHTWKK